MARITEVTRELLRKKILEKSQEKHDAMAVELQKLSECLDAESQKMAAKAVALITDEFENFNKNVARILKKHGLKFKKNYSREYTVNDIIIVDYGKAHINERAAQYIEAVPDTKDRAVIRVNNLRKDLEELDAKRQKACEDIELLVALGAKFDEVMELINNLQF